MSHNASERAAIGTAAVFLLLHLLPLVGFPSLWGMDFLYFYPAWVSISFIFLSGLLLFPGTRSLILHTGQHLFTRIPLWHPLSLCVLLLLSGILFWNLRSAVPLLGDGNKLIHELDALIQGRQLEVNRAPLIFWIVGSFYHLNHTAQAAFQLYSLIFRAYVFRSSMVGCTKSGIR